MTATILIGSSREQKLPSLVLEHSIRKNTKADVRIIHSWDLKFPNARRPENVTRTGFSFNRFGIPKLTGYQGRGIYLECDQLVFGDVQELLDIPFNGATVLRPENQAAVLVLDCDVLRWDVEKIVHELDEGFYSYHDLMERMCIESPQNIHCRIPGVWNSLERFVPEKTKNLHYTNMAEQPWRKWGHSLTGIWITALKEAIAAGLVTREIVEEEIRLKYVVPQVLEAAFPCVSTT